MLPEPTRSRSAAEVVLAPHDRRAGSVVWPTLFALGAVIGGLWLACRESAELGLRPARDLATEPRERPAGAAAAPAPEPKPTRQASRAQDPPAAQRPVRVSFVAGRLPEQWDLLMAGSRLRHGPIAALECQPEGFPARLSGEWRGAVIWQVIATDGADLAVEVAEHREIVVAAPYPAEGVAEWACYIARTRPDPRTFTYETHSFDAAGELHLVRPVGEALTIAVHAPGRPMFVHEVASEPPAAPWSQVRVVVEHGVAAPIQGRVTDRAGLPVADATVRITRLFGEAWGAGDYMVLDPHRTRALGGFAGDAGVDRDGVFVFREPAAATDQPFTVQVIGSKHRLVTPDRPLFTTRGGTWVDVVVD